MDVAQREIDQPIAIKVDGERVGGAKQNFPQPRHDHAVVTYVRCDERHQAAFRSGQGAGVENSCAWPSRLIEYQPARHEIRVAQVGRAGDQTPDIDLGSAAEHDAVRVDQQDLPVGVESAQNDRRLLTGDAIEGRGSR